VRSSITINFKAKLGPRFTCDGDGEPLSPGKNLSLSDPQDLCSRYLGHHGWLHWFNSPLPAGGRPNTDLWPDVSSYSPSELYLAPGLRTKTDGQVFLFSSRNAKTVQRHALSSMTSC